MPYVPRDAQNRPLPPSVDEDWPEWPEDDDDATGAIALCVLCVILWFVLIFALALLNA